MLCMSIQICGGNDGNLLIWLYGSQKELWNHGCVSVFGSVLNSFKGKTIAMMIAQSIIRSFGRKHDYSDSLIESGNLRCVL